MRNTGKSATTPDIPTIHRPCSACSWRVSGSAAPETSRPSPSCPATTFRKTGMSPARPCSALRRVSGHARLDAANVAFPNSDGRFAAGSPRPRRNVRRELVADRFGLRAGRSTGRVTDLLPSSEATASNARPGLKPSARRVSGSAAPETSRPSSGPSCPATRASSSAKLKGCHPPDPARPCGAGLAGPARLDCRERRLSELDGRLHHPGHDGT